MTNEELAILIQAGERDRLPELWSQVERFAAKMANRYLTLSGETSVEFGDLYNSSYIALAAAVDTFDPEAGKFLGWYVYALKTAFTEAAGCRSRKQAQDPLHRAASLDAPMGDDTEDLTLGDVVADPRAGGAFDAVESSIFDRQFHEAVERVLHRLPEPQARTTRLRFWNDLTLTQVAQLAGVYPETARLWQEKALRALRRSRDIQRFVEASTPYYLHVGVNAFQRTGESAVEKIVFKREKLEQRALL